MAKGQLPRIDDAPIVQQQEQPEERKPEHAPIAERYMRRRVDVKLKEVKHQKILHEKLRQLQDAGARLQDGTEVSDCTKVFLWILENLVDTSAAIR